MITGAADNENEHRSDGDSAADDASRPNNTEANTEAKHDEGPPTEAMSLEDIAAVSDGSASDSPNDSGELPPLVEPPVKPPRARAVPAAAELNTQPMSQQDLKDAAEPPEAGLATQPMSRRELAESLSAEEPTEVMRRPGGIPQPVSPKKPVGENTSAIDSLFGEGHFLEYEEQGLLPTIAPLVTPLREPKGPPPPGARFTHSQKILLWAAGILVAVLAIVALFLLGTRLGQRAEIAQPASTPTSTPTPTAAPADGAPAVAPGIYGWQALAGGECIQPFSSAWAETFTVVDCTTDHTGQLVVRGQLPDASGAPYPGAAALQTTIAKTCSVPTVLNLQALQSVPDTQITATFPPTADEWGKGDRWYYCFVSRKGGGLLPGDVKVAAG